MDLFKGPTPKPMPAWTVVFELNEYPRTIIRVTIRTRVTSLKDLEEQARERAKGDDKDLSGHRFLKAFPVGQGPVVNSEKLRRRRGKARRRHRR